MSSSPSRPLSILFLTVFVDLVGFGIVLPLLPFYADRFGANGVVIGLLVAVYSLAQLVCGPIWGRLSDRFGRRPILLIGLVGSAGSYLVFAGADGLGLLFLSRILAGVGGATIPVAQAYIADITPPGERAGRMGLIGAAFGLGFIVGPAMGGMLAPISSAAPGLAAAALCFTNAMLAWLYLPESISKSDRRALVRQSRGESRMKAMRRALTAPGLWEILALTLLFTTAFSALHPTFPLLADFRFGIGERGVGITFALMGLVSAIMQGVLVRRIVPRIGEVRLIRLSAAPFVAGFLLLGWATDLPLFLLGVVLLAVGFGGTLPSQTSLLSRQAPADLQGSVLGVGQSVSALGRIVGPMAAGLAFDMAGIEWPYFLGAAVGVAAFCVSLLLRDARDGTISAN